MLAHDLYRYILMSFSMHCLCICTFICCAVSTIANALVLYLEAFLARMLALCGIFPGEHLDRGRYLGVCLVNKGERLERLVFGLRVRV